MYVVCSCQSCPDLKVINIRPLWKIPTFIETSGWGSQKCSIIITWRSPLFTKRWTIFQPMLPGCMEGTKCWLSCSTEECLPGTSERGIYLSPYPVLWDSFFFFFILLKKEKKGISTNVTRTLSGFRQGDPSLSTPQSSWLVGRGAAGNWARTGQSEEVDI